MVFGIIDRKVDMVQCLEPTTRPNLDTSIDLPLAANSALACLFAHTRPCASFDLPAVGLRSRIHDLQLAQYQYISLLPRVRFSVPVSRWACVTTSCSRPSCRGVLEPRCLRRGVLVMMHPHFGSLDADLAELTTPSVRRTLSDCGSAWTFVEDQISMHANSTSEQPTTTASHMSNRRQSIAATIRDREGLQPHDFSQTRSAQRAALNKVPSPDPTDAINHDILEPKATPVPTQPTPPPLSVRFAAGPVGAVNLVDAVSLPTIQSTLSMLPVFSVLLALLVLRVVFPSLLPLPLPLTHRHSCRPCRSCRFCPHLPGSAINMILVGLVFLVRGCHVGHVGRDSSVGLVNSVNSAVDTSAGLASVAAITVGRVVDPFGPVCPVDSAGTLGPHGSLGRAGRANLLPDRNIASQGRSNIVSSAYRTGPAGYDVPIAEDDFSVAEVPPAENPQSSSSSSGLSGRSGRSGRSGPAGPADLRDTASQGCFCLRCIEKDTFGAGDPLLQPAHDSGLEIPAYRPDAGHDDSPAGAAGASAGALVASGAAGVAGVGRRCLEAAGPAGPAACSLYLNMKCSGPAARPSCPEAFVMPARVTEAHSLDNCHPAAYHRPPTVAMHKEPALLAAPQLNLSSTPT
ncbi:hypothetical protein PG989_000491 [Apiospora arundinis]